MQKRVADRDVRMQKGRTVLQRFLQDPTRINSERTQIESSSRKRYPTEPNQLGFIDHILLQHGRTYCCMGLGEHITGNKIICCWK